MSPNILQSQIIWMLYRLHFVRQRLRFELNNRLTTMRSESNTCSASRVYVCGQCAIVHVCTLYIISRTSRHNVIFNCIYNYTHDIQHIILPRNGKREKTNSLICRVRDLLFLFSFFCFRSVLFSNCKCVHATPSGLGPVVLAAIISITTRSHIVAAHFTFVFILFFFIFAFYFFFFFRSSIGIVWMGVVNLRHCDSMINCHNFC